MTDPYSVLGITPGADDETIKKAYRQKYKHDYHPDLHPNDPTARRTHFKEVQAAYSEIMRMKQGQEAQPELWQLRRSPGQLQRAGIRPAKRLQPAVRQPLWRRNRRVWLWAVRVLGITAPPGGARQTYTAGQESPELRAAANYIRSGFHEEVSP